MKKALLTSMIVLLVFTSMAFASNPIKININGVDVISDVPPVMQNDRVLVPVRVIAENLGYNVRWNEITNTVEISTPQTDRDPDNVKNDYNQALMCLEEAQHNISEAIRQNNAQSRVYVIMAKGWVQNAINYEKVLGKTRNYEDNLYLDLVKLRSLYLSILENIGSFPKTEEDYIMQENNWDWPYWNTKIGEAELKLMDFKKRLGR